MEEGNGESKHMATTEAVDGNEAPIEPQGSSKADLIDVVTCNSEEPHIEDVADNSFLGRLLIRYSFRYV